MSCFPILYNPPSLSQADRFHVVLSGAVGLYTSEGGTEKLKDPTRRLARKESEEELLLRAGAALGETALIRGGHAFTNAVAKTVRTRLGRRRSSVVDMLSPTPSPRRCGLTRVGSCAAVTQWMSLVGRGLDELGSCAYIGSSPGAYGVHWGLITGS